ncbi:hypothetical protein [uncultured Microbulbifer sp.]|uniref:hypothetical protein n=1 Tax=uncultured Microbulbifer sp. TaxID=348147 RepID=UPI002610CE56|nr:hypothetical protein [uncultured Microbulbifer sp.]
MNTQTEHWHLSKSVSVTQIVSIILLAAGLFIWGSDVEKGITANAQAIQHESDLRSLEQKHIGKFKDETLINRRSVSSEKWSFPQQRQDNSSFVK